MSARAARALLIAAWAFSGPAVSARADSACVGDAQRLCPGIPPGEGRVLTCLKGRWYQLSGACQQDIQAADNRAQQISAACVNDVWQFCRGVAPGQDRLRVCLYTRWNDLSSTCRDAIAELAQRAQAMAEQCGADAERLCPGVRPGGGLLWMCLKAHEGSASSGCQRALR